MATDDRRPRLSAAHRRWIEAAVYGAWGCRLAYARIKTPVHPPAIDQFDPKGGSGGVWLYDWHAHVLFASQLFEAARALKQSIERPELSDAFDQYAEHWANLSGLRNALMHPTTTAIDFESVRAGGDWIEYRKQGHDPFWRFTTDELHAPVEKLYEYIERLRD